MPLNVMLYRCFGGRNDDRDDDDDDGDGNDDNDNSDNGDANFVFIQQSLYIRVGSFPSHCLGNKTRVIKSQRALLNRLFSGRPQPQRRPLLPRFRTHDRKQGSWYMVLVNDWVTNSTGVLWVPPVSALRFPS